MAAMDELKQQASDLWDLFVHEVQLLASDLHHWVTHLSEQERMVGFALFVAVIIVMIFSRKVKTSDGIGTGRQFTGALFLIVIFAFGAGWSIDTQAGSLSHIFGR